MKHGAGAAHELHDRLKSFYNSDAEYFTSAREANLELTPERQHLFSFIEPGDRVLDVGCGPAENGQHLAGRVRYVGCDLSFLALKLANAALGGRPGWSVQSESQRLAFADDSFDVVLSTYALEHFVFVRESLDEMWRVCRPEGRIILISPAYDDPRNLPPSTSHWTRAERGRLMLKQAWRQFVRHVDRGKFYFARVERPRILSEKYESDFDAVHLVSAREIHNYFRRRGGQILFERKRAARSGNSHRGVGEHARNLLLRLGFGEYAGLNLQIVVVKPPPLVPRRIDGREREVHEKRRSGETPLPL